MCGIAGILHLDPSRTVDFDLLSRMTGVLAHRGPDDEGFHRDGPAGLGHRRLSIIDLSGGAQPMANEDGTVWIVFNGEIFNYQALRRDLEAKGHVFRTRSDTECIVHLYEEEGTGSPAKLVGQFAFAIWDSRRRRLFLARDQVGIKPLYYRLDGERLLFASELKAILEDEAVPREVDPEALVDYLTYRYVPAPRTIFRGIHKLPAGHWLLLENGRVRSERFWDIPLDGQPPESEEDCARKLEALLRDCVQSQLMSDVPLGAFLSGGIDSSIVVGLMAGLMDQPVKTFTIGFREGEFSEVAFAREVAQKYGTEHHELIVEPGSLELLPRLVAHFDEPFADPSAIPTYHVSRMAREHVTVCLSGDGGDEGFAGYSRYRWGLNYAAYDRIPRSLRTALGGVAGRFRGAGRLLTAARRLALDPVSRHAEFTSSTGGAALLGLLSPGMREVAKRGAAFALYHEIASRASGTDLLTRLQYIDIHAYLPDDILVKTDRTSMMSSLEVRVPLLDHRVLEFAASIPPSWRLGKRILKKAAAHLLPPAVLNRGKMGFGVPLKHWFREDWRAYANDLLLARRARERGFLEPGRVEALLEAQLRGVKGATNQVYVLVVLEEWCRRYLDGAQCPPSASSSGGASQAMAR